MENRDISQILYEQNQEYRTLFDEHRSLESRLVELSSHRYLSDNEQIEEVTLKKRKLALKDKMQELMRQHHP
ncbi:MAG TPA: YdcH family protein [Acidobacteriota bacterium]|nr:YdcH family protein [Acidobacteriota bacterium]